MASLPKSRSKSNRKSRLRHSVEPTPGYSFTHNILTSLPRQEVQELVNAGTELFLPKGKLLFKPGDRATGCYWLERGNIKASLKTRHSRIAS
jgi:CRP-like cAMP-binding protein